MHRHLWWYAKNCFFALLFSLFCWHFLLLFIKLIQLLCWIFMLELIIDNIDSSCDLNNRSCFPYCSWNISVNIFLITLMEIWVFPKVINQVQLILNLKYVFILPCCCYEHYRCSNSHLNLLQFWTKCSLFISNAFFQLSLSAT